jgi:RNA polymerase sigma-70 factor, ECF subfamily
VDPAVSERVSSPQVAGREVQDLFDEVAPRLWRVVLASAGGRRDVADDAVAEAFARAIEHGDRIRDPAPWLYRVALNLAARELRYRGRLTSIDGVEPAVEVPLPSDLVRMLRSLSPGQRAAVYLHYQEDLPVREVARLMGTSPAVVKVHLYRGRARLRELLGGDDDD